MTTEYFRVRNGLLIGENKFEVNADTGVITTAEGSTITNTELRAVTGGYAVITDQAENNYFYVDDNVTQVGAGTNSWYFRNDGTTEFPGYKFPATDGSANQVLKTNGAGVLTWQNDANTDAVQSVNSKTGVVVLTTTDINEGTNLYFTDARVESHVFNAVNIDNRSYLDTATLTTSATTAAQADSLKVDSVYRTASVDTSSTGTPNTVAVRDVDGNLNAVLFQGTATSALFADLAEKYLADDEYEVGTVVVVGGEQEITACSLGERAFGAISANPAYMMNAGLEGGTYVALKGRVPVKVIGAVRKGDKLLAADNGCAGVAHSILKNLPVRAGNFPDTFAIALEDNDDEGVKMVEAIIL